ncbi:Methyltranfer_dom domain-containing protein [Psidium guajava]|nr:Methyltranfer_dom domain-containing protein [Psidium guajava]
MQLLHQASDENSPDSLVKARHILEEASQVSAISRLGKPVHFPVPRPASLNLRSLASDLRFRASDIDPMGSTETQG